MKRLSEEKIILTLIILIAALLRFWNYWNWSFTHNELSALTRLHYSSFTELISKGVAENDSHPAFVQIFLWGWTKLFGFSETAVRLPFIMAGIGSVVLLFAIAKKWFGLPAAYFASLTLAVLDFPVLYSQLARPYSFGSFFLLLAIWCWNDFLIGDETNSLRKAILYGIATALCMLTEYFSALTALLILLSGFAFLKKENWKFYLLSCAIALTLFLPHLAITIHQWRIAGANAYSDSSSISFLWKFIFYGLNESSLLIVFLAIVALLSVLMYHLDFSLSKFHFICLAWFLIPLFIFYYHPLNANPDLQYSSMFIAYPFFPLLLFSFFKEKKPKANYLLLSTTALVLLYTLLIESNFYHREYFGVFKEINKAVTDLQDKHQSKNITTILNTSDKAIFNFYFDRWNKNIPYEFLAGDTPNFISSMQEKINSCTTPYFLYGWSNSKSDYEIPEMIKTRFPCILYDEKHFNSQVTLFGKTGSCKRDTLFFAHTGFEDQSASPFIFDRSKIDSTRFFSGHRSLNIDPKNEFCITLKSTVKNIFRDEYGCVNISAWILTEKKFNAQVVMEIGDPKGIHEWHARLLSQFSGHNGKWQEIFATLKLPSNAFPDDELTIYLWNPDKNSFYLDNFLISSFGNSNYDYYKTTFRK